jgi:hypothetical protein
MIRFNAAKITGSFLLGQFKNEASSCVFGRAFPRITFKTCCSSSLAFFKSCYRVTCGFREWGAKVKPEAGNLKKTPGAVVANPTPAPFFQGKQPVEKCGERRVRARGLHDLRGNHDPTQARCPHRANSSTGCKTVCAGARRGEAAKGVDG